LAPETTAKARSGASEGILFAVGPNVSCEGANIDRSLLMGEATMKMMERDYQEALQKCQQGMSSEELRQLYQMPVRERVPWELFPNWARPNDPVEGGHEGGSI
jgi:hypothetical protein